MEGKRDRVKNRESKTEKTRKRRRKRTNLFLPYSPSLRLGGRGKEECVEILRKGRRKGNE